MAEAKLELLINELMNPESEVARHALVRIAGLYKDGKPVRFSAVSNTTLAFQMGNSWTTIVDLAGGTSDTMVAGAQVIQDLLNKVGVSTKGKTYTPIFSEQYIELWKGPSKPTFSIDLVLFNYRNNDVRDDLLTLYSSVLPGSVGFGGGTELLVPLGYKASGGGTIMVELGTWFRATDLVVESVTSTFSKEVVKDSSGNYSSPLYATASLSFKPRKAITFSDFKGFFRNYPTILGVDDAFPKNPKKIAKNSKKGVKK